MSSIPRYENRIGIDFGNTIGEVERENPAPLAFEMIKHLVAKIGPQNCFIVSKAKPQMEVRIREWLGSRRFERITGFLPENIIFVLEDSDKARVVQDLEINIFFDDSTKIVRSLSRLTSMKKIFWMNTDTAKIKLISRQFRNKITLTKSWGSTMSYFQKIKRKRSDGQ